jgi:hypothetical protein
MNGTNGKGPQAKAPAPLDDRPRIVRPLGKMERSVWIYDRASTFNMGSSVDIEGSIPESDLTRALLWCQQRHPLLRSVVRQKGKKLFFACYDAADAPPIPLEISSGAEEDQDRIATEELRKPFDGFREPMVRLRMVRFSPDRSSLFLTFQHFIGDGFSAVNLLVDLVAMLGTLSTGAALPPVEPRPFPPAMEEGIAPQFKGFSGLMKMIGCQGVTNRRFKELGGMPTPMRITPDVPFAERLPVIETFGFSESETAALIERARGEKVTLYALLIGILLDAVYPFLDENAGKKSKQTDPAGRVVLMPIPSNVRPFLSLSAKTDFAFYASSFDLIFRLTEQNDILQLAREVRSEIKSGTTKESARLYVIPSLASIMDWKLFFPNSPNGLDRAARFIASMAKFSATSLTFLNLQKFNDRTGGLTVTNVRGYVAPSMLGTALFSAVLFDGVLNIHLIYNEKQFSANDAARLKSSIRSKALLVAGCQQTAAAGQV